MFNTFCYIVLMLLIFFCRFEHNLSLQQCLIQSPAHAGDFSCNLLRQWENQNLRVTTAQLFILKWHFLMVAVAIAKAPFSWQVYSTARNKKYTISDCSSRYRHSVETQRVRLRSTETQPSPYRRAGFYHLANSKQCGIFLASELSSLAFTKNGKRWAKICRLLKFDEQLFDIKRSRYIQGSNRIKR